MIASASTIGPEDVNASLAELLTAQMLGGRLPEQLPQEVPTISSLNLDSLTSHTRFQDPISPTTP